MTTFLIGCAAMIVAALVLVLVPLLRNTPAEDREKAPARAVPAAVAVMVILPLAASAFYGATSNFPWDNPAALGSGGGGHAQDGGSMEEVTRALEARLEQSPGDAEGWRMLGRTYLVSGRPADAVSAYEKARALTGGRDAGLELDLAEALVLTEQPEAQQRALGMIDAALAADADSQKALWYSGVLAARSGDQETAKARFGRLLELDPPPQIREIVVAQLAGLGVTVPAAEGAPAAGMGAMGSMGMGGGGMGSAAGTPAAAPEATGRMIRIAVSIDPALAGRLKPGTPVFVSAREAGIPGPPIAAVRVTSDELPTTVVLSDANSMIEGRTLSSVDEVQVVARVAFGGTPVPASGDLVGEARHSKGGAPDVGVVIDRVAP